MELKVPRKVRSQQVKQKIFAAALTLLEEKGYEYVTVQNVCQLAKVSVGSFYHHFKNKDDLLSYYFVEGYKKYEEKFKALVQGTLTDKIVYYFHIYSQFCLDQDVRFIRNFYTSENASLYLPAEMVTDPTKLPVLHLVYQELQKAQQSGELSPELDPIQLAEDLCLLEKGCIFEYALSNGRFDLLTRSEFIVRQFMKGFKLAEISPEQPGTTVNKIL